MTTNRPNRESLKIDALVREYSSKGYSVVKPTSIDAAPPFLHKIGYIPDLIATSAQNNIIFEVRTRENLDSLAHIAPVSDLINAQSGWQFVLVVTNPQEPSSPIPQPDLSTVKGLLSKSREFGTRDQTFIEASFIFGWSALEGSLGLLLETRLSGSHQTASTLVRDAAIAGLLDRDDALVLTRLLRVRNSLVHGGSGPKPTLENVEFVVKLAQATIEGLSRKDQPSSDSDQEKPTEQAQEYRRKGTLGTWHFCANCSTWPTSGYDISLRRPVAGELCNECSARERSGTCH